MKTLSEIKTVLHAHAAELRERYGIVNLAVFGSVARGEAADNSDVDILADVPDDMSLLSVIAVENTLGDLLGMKVDFIPRTDVRQELKQRIFTESVAV